MTQIYLSEEVAEIIIDQLVDALWEGHKEIDIPPLYREKDSDGDWRICINPTQEENEKILQEGSLIFAGKIPVAVASSPVTSDLTQVETRLSDLEAKVERGIGLDATRRYIRNEVQQITDLTRRVQNLESEESDFIQKIKEHYPCVVDGHTWAVHIKADPWRMVKKGEKKIISNEDGEKFQWCRHCGYREYLKKEEESNERKTAGPESGSSSTGGGSDSSGS